MKIVFVGGLEDGKMVLEYLFEIGESVVGVFVLDEKYSTNVAGFISFDDFVPQNLLYKVKRINARKNVKTLKSLEPDLILIVGWSQIISKEILDIPKFGTIGFHTSLLPERRGCSPVVWAIVDGLTETGVTMFYYDTGIDTGDIIGQKKFKIELEDDSLVVLNKANQATLDLVKEYLSQVKAGTAPRIPQDESRATYTRRRGEKDGEIDWSKPSMEIYNLIRALRPPYPCAHTYGGDGEKIHITGAQITIRVPQHTKELEKHEEIDWSKTAIEIYNLIRNFPYRKAYTYAGDGKKIYITEAKLG